MEIKRMVFASRIKVTLKDGSAIYVANFETGKPDGAPVWRAVLTAKEAQVFISEDAENARKEMIHWYNTVGKEVKQDEPEIELERLDNVRMMTPEEVRTAAADLAEKIGFDACEDSILYCRIEEAIREMPLFITEND